MSCFSFGTYTDTVQPTADKYGSDAPEIHKVMHQGRWLCRYKYRIPNQAKPGRDESVKLGNPVSQARKFGSLGLFSQ